MSAGRPGSSGRVWRATTASAISSILLCQTGPEYPSAVMVAFAPRATPAMSNSSTSASTLQPAQVDDRDERTNRA